MFVRMVRRKNSDGSEVQYLQLAHSVREPESKFPRNKVLLGLGRVDRDGPMLESIARGILRYVDRKDIAAAHQDFHDQVQLNPSQTRDLIVHDFESRSVGMQVLLWALWTKLELSEFFVARDPVNGDRHARLTFLIVLNRVLDPRSKHALPGWAERVIACDNGADLRADDFYAVLDVIADCDEPLQRYAFEQMRALTGDTTNLALYDTTSASFEMDEDDTAIAEREATWKAWEAGPPDAPPPDVRRPQLVNDPPLRLRGYSREHRGDLPQAVIGLATTERGLPIRAWLFPGNTVDATTVPDIQQDLAATGVRHTVFVGDRGMTSELNLSLLESENVPFIVGRKLRDRSAAIRQLLDTAGPMERISDDRECLELPDPKHPQRRLLLVRHRGRATRDAKVRVALVASAAKRAEAVNTSSKTHPRAACELETRRALARLLTKDETGALRIDDEAVATEARLDGVMVLTTNTDWPAARVVEAYQALLRTEDGWRTMKTVESLRPVHHRRADRIRAHTTCCALGLGLIRTVEHLTGQTWGQVVDELRDVARVRFSAGGRQHAVVTKLRPAQERIYELAGVAMPARAGRQEWFV